MHKIILAALAGTIMATPALAQTQPQPVADAEPKSTIAAGVTAGSLGIGPELGWRINDTVAIRGNATFFGVNGSFDSDDLEYDGELKLRSFGAMIDIYPFGGNFRLSGGARINRNEVEILATPTGTFEIGGEVYTQQQVGTLSGRADARKVAPTLTLGWAGQNRRGFMVGFEAGAMFQGAMRIDEFRATGTAANDPTFRASLEEERRSLQDDVDKVKVYPILQLSIGYRF